MTLDRLESGLVRLARRGSTSAYLNGARRNLNVNE
jgi:hypothetical protein